MVILLGLYYYSLQILSGTKRSLSPRLQLDESGLRSKYGRSQLDEMSGGFQSKYIEVSFLVQVGIACTITIEQALCRTIPERYGGNKVSFLGLG
jgi:hypothetical protein